MFWNGPDNVCLQRKTHRTFAGRRIVKTIQYLFLK